MFIYTYIYIYIYIYKNIKRLGNNYKGKCTPCNSGIRSLRCLQVQNTHLFRIQQMDEYLTAKVILSSEIDFNLRKH